MTTAESSNTIKVFYHPLIVVVNVQKVAGERYFFYGKAEGALNTFKVCSNVYFNTEHAYNFNL